MTEREIKFELSKAALTGGRTIEVAKQFYDWVIAAPELEAVDKKTQLDETPIERLAFRTRIARVFTTTLYQPGSTFILRNK